MDNIQCSACSRKIVPRLWHRSTIGLFFAPRVQHICPFCGTVLYETGGGLNGLSKLLIFFFVLFPAVAMLRSIERTPGGRFASQLVLLLAAAGSAYWIFNRVKAVITHRKFNR